MMKPLELAVAAVVAIAIAATIADTASGEAPESPQPGLAIRLGQAEPTPRLASPEGRQARGRIEKTCGVVTYELTTGNGKGSCASGVSLAECTDGVGNTVRMSCDAGCSPASGSANCQQA